MAIVFLSLPSCFPIIDNASVLCCALLSHAMLVSIIDPYRIIHCSSKNPYIDDETPRKTSLRSSTKAYTEVPKYNKFNK